jgi:hypothetical protein
MGIACFCPAERVHYISEAKAIIGEPVSTKGVGIVNGTIAVLPKTATLKTIDIRLTQTLKRVLTVDTCKGSGVEGHGSS